MLELLLAVALGVGLVRAGRARHAAALCLGGLALYLLCADTLAALEGNRGAEHFFYVFSYTFLGPGAGELRGQGALPLPHLFVQHPLLLRSTRLAVCWGAAWACARQSAKLNPLLPRAYELDAIATPFVGAGVLDAVEGVVLVYAIAMAGV